MRFTDLHNDFLLHLPSTVIASVWTTELQDPMAEIRRYRSLWNGMLHIEDGWFITPENIDEIIAFRPYSVGLTWNTDNALAGGAHGNGDLTPWGRKVIEKLVKAGIIIDLAHLNRQSFWSVVELLKERGQKLFCSHCCFDEIHPHPRNLDREQLRAIVESDGIVGLTPVEKFLGDGGFHAHLDYFIENFGSDNIGIGTDYPYGEKILWRNFERFNCNRPQRPRS